MGEIMISSSDEDEVMRGSEQRKDGMVKWEKFLPTMALRVLLVEADDSTRQIIAALLRKCSYKVVAVADGLKAWEVIKGRPEDIDLILTEVDLPSISGFALLTLITEHEACKNIPVIMMSAYDSVNMVYKCMLRGAADFLMKPIRRNELTNLWQHVWRRQSAIAGGNGDSVAQQKIEATSENNAASNNSSGSMASIQRENKERIEKGSDTQSSCTKPDLEAESAYVENLQDFSQAKHSKSSATDKNSQKDEECLNLDQTLLMHEREAGESDAVTSKIAIITTPGEGLEQEQHDDNAIIMTEACDNNVLIVNSSREAIDLIGSFDNHIKSNYRDFCSTDGINKMDCSPHLDLSLRRCHPIVTENQLTDESRTMNHSNSSPFSRYQSLQPLYSTLTSVSNQQKEYGTDSDKHFSSLLPSYNSDSSCPTNLTQKSVITTATNQSEQAEIALPYHQQRAFPVPVQVRGLSFDSTCTSYGSVLAQIFSAQSGSSPNPNPSSAGQKDTSYPVNPSHQSHFRMNNSESEQFYNRLDQNTRNFNNQTINKQEDNTDSLEDEGHVSPTTDRSANSSFCNGAASQLNSIGHGSVCRSNGNVNLVAVAARAAEINNENTYTRDENSHRSIQREAALNKFRLKRKDRCYEKKVRYESRKKLAEKRPRVKGQFVRQVHTDPSIAETDIYCGNSPLDC